jgi:hypothetical protein
VAAVFLAGNDPLPWNPDANQAVNILAINGTRIFAGGSFTTIGGQTRNRLASLDLINGVADSWNPNLNSNVNDLSINNNTLYVAGSFYYVNGNTTQRSYLASYDLSNNELTNWNPVLNGSATAIFSTFNISFIAGNFTNAANQTLQNFAIINDQGYCSPWYPSFNSTTQSILLQDSILYLGGNFYSYDGEECYYMTSIVYPWSAFVVSNKELKNENMEVQVYPNPSEGSFNLVLPEQARNGSRVRIVNTQGRTVWDQAVPVSSGAEPVSLKVDLNPGFYLLDVTSESGTFSQKILIK